MPLPDAPESLAVEHDLHGIRCVLEPRLRRSFRARLGWSAVAGFATVSGLVAAIGGVVGALGGGDPRWWALTLAGALLLCGLLLLVIIDSAAEHDRYQLRLGEGWVVLRFEHQRSEVRVDLTAVRSCEVLGREITLRDVHGDAVQLPLGGHGPEEIRWLAMAIDKAVHDARRDEDEAPAALLTLLLR